MVLINIRLGCKGKPGSNTPAYFIKASEAKKKSFITLVTVCYKKLLTPPVVPPSADSARLVGVTLTHC